MSVWGDDVQGLRANFPGLPWEGRGCLHGWQAGHANEPKQEMPLRRTIPQLLVEIFAILSLVAKKFRFSASLFWAILALCVMRFALARSGKRPRVL